MLDLSKSPVVPTSRPDRTQRRREYEDFCRKCNCKVPEEVAELFINYTRWIWEYKCIGAINKFYNDETIIHTENGGLFRGADSSVTSSLISICAYPDKINDFIDIIVEGNEEDGYSFGQSTRQPNTNTGYSKFGPPTGKFLGKDGIPLFSICELTVKKIGGRWRVTEEWVVEGTEVKRQTLTPDDIAVVEKNIGILPDDVSEVAKAAEAAAKAADAAAAAAKAAAQVAEALMAMMKTGKDEEE